MVDFHTQAYELQASYHGREREAIADEHVRLLHAWQDETTADYWRHSRMYDFARHFAKDTDATWLTIGDGRFGIDSIELKKRGIKKVLPSDISESALIEAKNNAWIDDFAVENAEKLSFGDGAFDYVLCKESYHHFPRPFIAVYEMLRVARKAALIVEPNDYWKSIIGSAVFQLKRVFGKTRHMDQDRYEPSGNYVYSISLREIEKVCLGLDLPTIFFKGLNDVYVAGCEYAPARWSSPIFLRMRLMTWMLDLLCYLRLFKPTRLMVCIFKCEPPKSVRRALTDNGWRCIDLPRNPHRIR